MELVVPPLLITAYLRGASLTLSMATVAWGMITASDDVGQTPRATPAD
jgi:hypothetical protein